MEMYFITTVKQLIARDIKVEILCYPESRIHLESNSLNIMIHTVKASNYFHPLEAFRLKEIIKNGSYDVVHIHASKDLWVLVPALKLLKSTLPLLLTKHVGSFVIKKDFLHKWLYKRVTFALAISEVIRKNLIETCPLPEEKVLLLHNGISLKKFEPLHANRSGIRNEFGIKENELLIGMLARFSPGKGHEEFLSAAESLSKKYENLKFVVIGEASKGEGDYAEHIKQQAVERTLSNVIFAGFRSDTRDVLSAMDIFVFPSHAEAFGLALVEAMAMKLPSVCSNSDGILDIAVEGVTSFMFEKKNSNEMTEKIEMLIHSQSKRNEMGEAARVRVEENFGLEIHTDKLLNIYRDSVNSVLK
jgi:glycosyltransferase involved in cell wall biosynthesis